MKRIIIISFLIILSFLTPGECQMEFIPSGCDCLILTNPSVLLDAESIKDKVTKLRFETIISEINKKIGFEIQKDANVAGFYVMNLHRLLDGARPKGVIFVQGQFDKKKIIMNSKVKNPSKIKGFEVYSLGQGVCFAFTDNNILLFGGLDDVLAGMMAEKKSAMSGAGKFSEIISSYDEKGFGLGISLKIDKKLIGIIEKIAGTSLVNNKLTADLSEMNFSYNIRKGLELIVISGNKNFVKDIKPWLEGFVKMGIDKMKEEILEFKGKTGKLTGAKSVVTGMKLSYSVLKNLSIEGQDNKLELTVPMEKIKEFSSALFNIVLKVFNRNYNVASGKKGDRRCMANMKILEGASELHFMDKGKDQRKDKKPEILVKESYIRKMPECPDGGKYTIKAVDNGFSVNCSKHGDLDEIYDNLYNPKKMK